MFKNKSSRYKFCIIDKCVYVLLNTSAYIERRIWYFMKKLLRIWSIIYTLFSFYHFLLMILKGIHNSFYRIYIEVYVLIPQLCPVQVHGRAPLKNDRSFYRSETHSGTSSEIKDKSNKINQFVGAEAVQMDSGGVVNAV